jgi:hypothetical protein
MMLPFAVCLAVLATSAARAADPVSAPINIAQAELEIRATLAEKVTLEFAETPLTSVLAYLHDKYHLQIQLDTPELFYLNDGKKVTIDPAKLLVSINVKNVTLRSALNLILNLHNLTWIIKDEVLKITSEDMRHGELYSVTYPVADLVIPIPNFSPDVREGINAAMREAYGRMGWSGAAGGSVSSMGPFGVAQNEGSGSINPTTLAQFQPAVGVPIGSGGPPRTGQSQGKLLRRSRAIHSLEMRPKHAATERAADAGRP